MHACRGGRIFSLFRAKKRGAMIVADGHLALSARIAMFALEG
ncbi:hypothetical protein SXCC_01164 [Gluconacetobacter sp. SXCC-1]|nr:hypothetical protein SXCC_01164 [Gluconacetobacter sp. SXCC-1]